LNLDDDDDDDGPDALAKPCTMRPLTAALAGLSLAQAIHAFYLPGAAPRDYASGERVDLLVNALTPMLAGTDDSKLVRMINICDIVKTLRCTLSL
jgi:hypothetical protein